MIPWLMQRASIGMRVVVTIFLGLIVAALFLAVLIVGDSIHKRLEAEFKALQEDHREIRALMTRNTAKFSGIMEQNTQAVNKAAETVKQVHEQ